LLVALADKRPIPYKKTSRASIQESDRREEVDDQGDVKVGTNTQDESDLEAGDTPSNERARKFGE
jgi:hypothetical protein